MKDFQSWHRQKAYLEEKQKHSLFEEGDIFYTHVGYNVGYEQDGNKQFLRPVLIYKKFSSRLFLGIPLSKTEKNGKFYYSFIFQEGVTSTALLSQVKIMDAKRLLNRIGKISPSDFSTLHKKLIKLITPSKIYPPANRG